MPYRSVCIIKVNVIDPDDGDRASIRNVGFELNIDTADCPRGFFIATITSFLDCSFVIYYEDGDSMFLQKKLVPTYKTTLVQNP
jgi:hypothetical protein